MDQSIDFEQMRQMLNLFTNFSGPRETPSPRSDKADDPTPESMRILKTVMPYMESPAQGQLGILLKFMELQDTVSHFEREANKESSADFQRSASSNAAEFSPRKQRELLKSIRDVCGQDKQKIINMALQTMQMQELMKMYQPQPQAGAATASETDDATETGTVPPKSQPDMGSVLSFLRPAPSEAPPSPQASGPAVSSSLSEELKQGLTPEQQQMFDNLTSFMNNTPPKGAPNE